jgi:hypothetical protein
MIFAEDFEFIMKDCTEEGGQGIQMEIAFRHVKEEGVIGSEEVERGEEAEGEGLSQGGSIREENQCG